MKSNRRGSWIKSLSFGLASVLVAGAMATSAPPPARVIPAEGAAPLDLAIANPDRLIDSLVQRGVIPAGLDPEAAEQRLHEYLQKRAQGAESAADKGNGRNAKAQALRNEAGIHRQTPVDSATAQAWNGGTQTDKILALLVDYRDYAHNSIQPGETDMYYPAYTREHYQQMLFGDHGYTGPNGENLVSMRQYYLQQSGGSYTVEGDVYGWFALPQTAAYYGGNNAADNDSRPRNAVYNALQAAVANGVNLADYDQEDIYDLDGDGNLREPDGLVDHLMVIHAGVGEEAGGGSLGADAIWSHRSTLGGVYTFPGTTATVPYWGGRMGAYDYTIEPEDGATGVFAHEFGHDLGYPDEYDTIYSGRGEPVAYYSIMSTGSWAGTIPGTEPVGFSPLAKQFYQQKMGGNWQHGKTVDFADLTKDGVTVTLDQATTKGVNEDVVRINLPDQVVTNAAPASGSYVYWGGRGDEIDHTMIATVDLTGATSATLEHDVWYNTEANWDYGFVQVSTDGGAHWTSLATPNTSANLVAEGYPAIRANLPGYTGSSGGWKHEAIDLSAYAGQSIKLQYRYMTDWGTSLGGFLVDNVRVTKNGTALLNDGAESASAFALHGFTQNDGTYKFPHYYLVEWRNHDGVDKGLAHINVVGNIMANDPGMLIWYVNGAYEYNWVGVHPGKGFVGVVDAHQNVHHWGGSATRGALASTRYQIYDAAFSLQKGGDLALQIGQFQLMQQAAKNPVATFDDRSNWWSPSSIYAGLKLPSYGLRISVIGEASDRSAATIKITK